MPTSMPHAGVEENKKVLQQLDMAVASIPEIRTVLVKPEEQNRPLTLPLCRCMKTLYSTNLNICSMTKRSDNALR